MQPPIAPPTGAASGPQRAAAALLPILLVLTPSYRHALYWVREHAPTRRWIHVTAAHQVRGRWPVEWVDLGSEHPDPELAEVRRGLLRMATLGGAAEWSPPTPHRDGVPVSTVTFTEHGLTSISSYSGPHAQQDAERLAEYWRALGRAVVVEHGTATAGPR